MIHLNFMVSLLIRPKYAKICATQDSEAKLFKLWLARLPPDWWRRCNFDKPTTSTALTVTKTLNYHKHYNERRSITPQKN